MSGTRAGAATWSAQDPLGLGGSAIAVVDGQGRIMGWTGGAEAALGFRADEVVGRSGSLLLVNPGTATELAAWGTRADARESWSGVVQLRRKDGSVVKMMLEASAVLDRGRTDWFVTATDPSGASFWEPARPAVAATLLARSPIGLSIWDTDLRCIWMNSAAERHDGVLRGKRLGQRMTDLQPGAAGAAITASMRHVLETGEPIVEREYSWRLPGTHEERVMSASYFRLDGPDGKPIGVACTATDIDRSLARQHLLLLGRTGNRIGTTLDVLKTAQELADAAVPLLADYVTVDLADAVPLGEEPLQHLPSSESSIPAFRRAGVASVHPDMPEALWRIGEVVFVPPNSPFTRALLSGKSQFEPVLDVTSSTWVALDPPRARIIEETGVHSLIIVPLQARGTILGEAVFVRNDNKVPFSRDDLLLIEELVGRTALSLDNARRYTRERAASIALQRNLLPKNLSGSGAVDVASLYQPAGTHKGVGGDWFDAIPLSGGRIGLVVGDVVGHGINAAATMGQHRTMMRTLADLDLPPEELLARLDRLVVSMACSPDGETEPGAPVMSSTCAYAVYDPVTRLCTVASAGHPPPALLYPDGSVAFADVSPGPPIGLGTMAYESVTLELPENTVIALYTDGLIETRTADIDAGMSRLGVALAQPAFSLEHLCAQIVHTMAPRTGKLWGIEEAGARSPSEDDVALLLARTRVRAPEPAGAPLPVGR